MRASLGLNVYYNGSSVGKKVVTCFRDPKTNGLMFKMTEKGLFCDNKKSQDYDRLRP